MNERQEVLAIGATLAIGETTRGSCPFCGDSGSDFAITRFEHDVRFVCHRASCGRAGVLYLDGRNAPVRPAAPRSAFVPEPALTALPPAVELELIERYHLTRSAIRTARWRWAPEKHRVYMPILDRMGTQGGYVLRSLRKGTLPKAITIRAESASDASGLSWHSDSYPCSGSPLIVVEGTLDAVRGATLGGTWVAMLGSNINDATAASIRPDALWFDPDATAKAVKLRTKYAPLWGSGVKVVRSRADPKDSTDGEILEHVFERA
jgi:hypothetical protein